MLIFNKQTNLVNYQMPSNYLTISNGFSFVPATPATLWKHRGHVKKKHDIKAPSSDAPTFILEDEPKTQDKHMQVPVMWVCSHITGARPLWRPPQPHPSFSPITLCWHQSPDH